MKVPSGTDLSLAYDAMAPRTRKAIPTSKSVRSWISLIKNTQHFHGYKNTAYNIAYILLRTRRPWIVCHMHNTEKPHDPKQHFCMQRMHVGNTDHTSKHHL